MFFKTAKYFLYSLIFLFIIVSSAFGNIYQFSPLFSFKNGTNESSLKWNVVNGEIPYGYAEGPSSFLTMEDGNIIISDSLNCRIVICSNIGVILHSIDLERFHKNGKLRYSPLIIDFSLTSKKNLYLADIANNRVLLIDFKGNLLNIIGKTGNKDGEFQQINRVHSDGNENLYVEDQSLQRTILFTRDGYFIRNFSGLTSVLVDKYGNITTLEYSDAKKRKIVVYNNRGVKSEILGFIEDNKVIKYASLLGYDKNNNLHITYDIDDFRIYIKFDILKNIEYKKRTPLFDVGIDVTTPEWLSPDGEIYSIKALPEKFIFCKLKMRKNLRIK